MRRGGSSSGGSGSGGAGGGGAGGGGDRSSAVMKELFDPVQTAWTPGRAQDVQARVERAVRRRVIARRATVGAVAVAAVVFGGVRFARDRGGDMAREVDLAPGAVVIEPLRLDDGSTVVPLAASALTVSASAPERKVVRIERGGARFDVRPVPQRLFRVEAGEVAVEVLGTAFDVERAGERVRVAVSRGRVRVLWAAGVRRDEAVLLAGESGVYPPPAPPSPIIEPITERTTEPPAKATPEPATDRTTEPLAEPSVEQSPAMPAPAARPRRDRPSSWRALAQRGRFEEAYSALKREGPTAVPDEPGALLAAADVARLSHHPAEAAARFRTVIDRYPRDPRASLAAFHLGLVLLEELGRPREAASAFARCRQLDPGGDLVEDALAREVEADFRAGDAAAARERADEYLRRYPAGRRANAVRGYGGLR